MHGRRSLRPTLVPLDLHLESVVRNPRGRGSSSSTQSITSMEGHNEEHVEDLGYIDQQGILHPNVHHENIQAPLGMPRPFIH